MISPNFQNVNQLGLTQGFNTNAILIRGGRDAAMNYPVQYGYAAFIIDEENGEFFIKINDTNGNIKPLREFKYEEITHADPNAFDPSQFATKEDFNMLLNEIKKLSGREEKPRRYNDYKPRRNRDGQSYGKSI